MNQEKSSNMPPGEGGQKALLNVKDSSCSIIMGSPTKEWGKLPSTGLMLCQTSTQEVQQTEPISNSLRKGDARIMHAVNTILADAAEAGDSSSPHSSVGDPTTRLHKAFLTFTNAFWYPPPGGLLEYFSSFIFLNASEPFLSLSWVGQSLFPE